METAASRERALDFLEYIAHSRPLIIGSNFPHYGTGKQ